MAQGHQPVDNEGTIEAAPLPSTPPVLGTRERERTRGDTPRVRIKGAAPPVETAGEGPFDVADYVFGVPPFETVVEPDERIEIEDTTETPWRRVCQLLITASDGTKLIGTGWLIGRRTVITAGHCVYLRKAATGAGTWARSILVSPAKSGDDLPFDGVQATRFRTVDSWQRDGAQQGDYGAILLDRALGDEVGWFSVGHPRDELLVNQVVNISGYPYDRDKGKRQYYHSRGIGSVDEHILWYDVDTEKGQSGSPIWVTTGGRRVVVGIHNMGIDSTRRHNSGTRISQEVFDNLNQWKREGDAS